MLIARFEGHLSILSLKSMMVRRGRVFETLQINSILTYPSVLTLHQLHHCPSNLCFHDTLWVFDRQSLVWWECVSCSMMCNDVSFSVRLGVMVMACWAKPHFTDLLWEKNTVTQMWTCWVLLHLTHNPFLNINPLALKDDCSQHAVGCWENQTSPKVTG